MPRKPSPRVSVVQSPAHNSTISTRTPLKSFARPSSVSMRTRKSAINSCSRRTTSSSPQSISRVSSPSINAPVTLSRRVCNSPSRYVRVSSFGTNAILDHDCRSPLIPKKLKRSKWNIGGDQWNRRLFFSRHLASRTEQEAKGHLERQKIKDEAEGKSRHCLSLPRMSSSLSLSSRERTSKSSPTPSAFGCRRINRSIPRRSSIACRSRQDRG